MNTSDPTNQPLPSSVGGFVGSLGSVGSVDFYKYNYICAQQNFSFTIYNCYQLYIYIIEPGEVVGEVVEGVEQTGKLHLPSDKMVVCSGPQSS